tara:strand:+ start:36 stop:1142 length:1107 start_codon:yes stop_codon:yes gene_type:complete
MKNKLIITLIGISLSTSFVYSQRPNTKKIAIPYLQEPLNPLDNNIESYHSSVVNNSTFFQPKTVNILNIFKSSGITQPSAFQSSKQKIILNGFKEMNSLVDADIEIRFVINNVSFSSNVFKEEYKRKINDTTYVNAIGGKYRVDATVNYSEFIIDNKNDKKVISNEGIIVNNLFVSSLFSEYAPAVIAHDKNKDFNAMNLYSQIINQSLQNFQYGINNNYGFPLKYYDINFVRGRGRKYDYSDLSKAFENIGRIREIVKRAFIEGATSRYGNFTEKMRNEISKKIDECISIWGNAIKEYVPKKRRTRIGDKIIDHLYINLSVAYFLKGNWDKSYNSLSRVKISKGEIKEASKFRSKIEDYVKRININK